MSPTDGRLWSLDPEHRDKLVAAGIPFAVERVVTPSTETPVVEEFLKVPEWVVRAIIAIRAGSAVTSRAPVEVYVKALRALDADPELRAAMMALYLTLPHRSGRHAALYEFLGAKGVL